MPPYIPLENSSSDIVSLSRSLISRPYSGTPSSILLWLRRDIIWIDTTVPLYCYDYYQAIRKLNHASDIQKHEIRHLRNHIRDLQDGICILTEKYKAVQKETDRFGICRSYQTTMVWTSDQDSPPAWRTSASPLLPLRSPLPNSSPPPPL